MCLADAEAKVRLTGRVQTSALQKALLAMTCEPVPLAPAMPGSALALTTLPVIVYWSAPLRASMPYFCQPGLSGEAALLPVIVTSLAEGSMTARTRCRLSRQNWASNSR